MMIVRPGEYAVIKRGRKEILVHVTDAVDQSAPEVIQNPDNIAMGNLVYSEGGMRVETSTRVVFNMEEVTGVLV